MKANLFFIAILNCVFSISVFAQEINQDKSSTTLKSDPNIPIFEIKNDKNQTVFAVYPGGVKIFIEDQLKATGGGFTVGRLGTGKADGTDFLIVNPGDVRVNIADPLKATGGGFTVGRLGTGKAGGNSDFLSVKPDTTTINIDETSNGGFFVGKIGKSADVNKFLNISPDNYFIGHQVAPNLTTGLRNSIIGYYAGFKLNSGNSNIVLGDSAGFNLNGGTDNIIIGNKAGHNLTGSDISGGRWNIFLGNNAGMNSISPVRNIFIGYDAGRENLAGQYNLYVGNQAGRNGTGFYNTVIGANAASSDNFGNGNVVLGYVAGRDMVSSNNVFLGMGAGYNHTGVTGNNVFIGYYAGEEFSSQANRLAIATNRSGAPLIYGEFDTKRVAINSTTTNSYTFYVNGTAGGTGAWNETSDLRLKKNIFDITSPIEKILQLRGVSFEWLDPVKFDDKKHIGFIAQEVKEVLPEVVNYTNDSYSMQYAPITALLVEAIKEQQTTIDGLKKQNELLLKKIQELESLKSEIETIKQLINKED